MFASIALSSFRLAPAAAVVASRGEALQFAKATVGRYIKKDAPFAVDAPDGYHDDQALEECGEWANRVIKVASITEDANAINEMHDAILNNKTFAVDAPDGEHDLKDIEECGEWVNHTIKVASVIEDANAINEMHDAVLNNKAFAVDAPDGEHDSEDLEEHMVGVHRIINEASIFENPEEVRGQQELRDDVYMEALKNTKNDL